MKTLPTRPPCFRKPTPVTGYQLTMVLCLTMLSLCRGDVDASLVGAFKAFLQSPPAIDEMTFTISSPTSRTNHYWLRWQTNAFVLLNLGNDAGVNTNSIAHGVGRYAERYWTLGGGLSQNATVYQRVSSAEDNNPVWSAYVTAMFETIAFAMGFGISSVEPGTLLQESEHLFVSPQAALSVEIRPALDTPRSPVSIRVYTTSGYNAIPRDPRYWNITYEFEAANLPVGVPSRILWQAQTEHGLIGAKIAHITSMTVASRPRPAADFDYTRYLSLPVARAYVVTNNALHYLSGDKWIRRMEPDDIQLRLTDPNRLRLYRRFYFFAGASLLALAGAATVWSVVASKTRSKTKQP